MVVDYASASAKEPSYIKVWIGAELIEEVYIGSYSPHTWWSNNPLFGSKEPDPGGTATIEVGPNALLRLESNLIT